jgi:hypothetical protein
MALVFWAGWLSSYLALERARCGMYVCIPVCGLCCFNGGATNNAFLNSCLVLLLTGLCAGFVSTHGSVLPLPVPNHRIAIIGVYVRSVR